MSRVFYAAILLMLFTACQAAAQGAGGLEQKIQRIVAGKKATVGVSIADADGREVFAARGDERFPLQSVFKFHIGLKVLAEVDRGNLALDQKIKIEKNELLPGLYSPLREKYPSGATLPVSELLEYAVSLSDNVACDVLLRLVGGPRAVEEFFARNGFSDVSIKINEEVMQANWNRQFENWTTPRAANRVLRAFYANDRKLLSEQSHAFVWQVMRETQTGANRLKKHLPEGAAIAHKTGTSGVNRATGVTAAVNDIGVVSLPGGGRFFISVFVTDSKESNETNERIIADIGKAAWDYFAAEKN